MKTTNVNGKSSWNTIIIGAGQAGLAAGYHLLKAREDFIIIDAAENIGDSWRKRWDSLRLFTPSQYDGLPGFPFPASRNTMPKKDEVADYFESLIRFFVMQEDFIGGLPAIFLQSRHQ